MVKVSFEGAFLSPSGNPSEEIPIGPAQMVLSGNARGEVHQYKDGAKKSITLRGNVTTFTVKIPAPSLHIQSVIHSWLGITVMYRDSQHRILWGLLKFFGYTKDPSLSDEYVNEMELEIETTTQDASTFVR